VIVRIHATLEISGVRGPVKEPRRDPQSADLVTGSPCVTDLVNLALQFTRRTQANDCLRFRGAWSERRWASGLLPLWRRQSRRLHYDPGSARTC
jgi:hypothetical protein